MCADEVHTLVPLISQPPSVLVALVLAANRSEPEFGSLMPIEKQTSPRQIRGRTSILLCSGAFFQQYRPALPALDEEAPGRRVGDAHFLGHHIAFEKAAFMAAIFFRPGH